MLDLKWENSAGVRRNNRIGSGLTTTQVTAPMPLFYYITQNKVSHQGT